MSAIFHITQTVRTCLLDGKEIIIKVRKGNVTKSTCKKLNEVIRRKRERRTIFSQHSRRIERANTTRPRTTRFLLHFAPYRAQVLQWENSSGHLPSKTVTTIHHVFRLRSRAYRTSLSSPHPDHFAFRLAPRRSRVCGLGTGQKVLEQGIGRSREEVGHGLIWSSDLPRPNDRRRR